MMQELLPKSIPQGSWRQLLGDGSGGRGPTATGGVFPLDFKLFKRSGCLIHLEMLQQNFPPGLLGAVLGKEGPNGGCNTAVNG